MKVLMVTPSYYPIVGGSEALTRVLSIKLNEIGIHTDIMTFNMNKKWNPIWKEEIKKDGPIRVFRVPAFNPLPGLPNPFVSFFKMNVVPKPSFIRRLQNYDVIHFIGEADLGFPLLSYFIQKPKIMHCVGIFKSGGIYKYYMFKRAFLRNIFTSFFPNLADLYIISSEEEEQLLSDLGVHTSKILILPIGVDVETFRPDETKKLDNLILFVGRIEKIKGLHILMSALAHLEIPTQLAIIGPRWDPKYVEEIERMCHAINENCVHKVELLGSMDQQSLVPWYQKATVLVCPYLYETYSTVTLEALACGTPVISTGTHILKQGSDGILVVPKNPKKLAEAIKKLLEDKEMREKYGREGRRLIEHNFSWESIVKRLVRVYEDMLGKV
jgi:glycosyltransferase involved in cell wall biosynthesis